MGQSNPPNGGQVTTAPQDDSDPHAWSKEILREIPSAAGQTILGGAKGAGSTLNSLLEIEQNYINPAYAGQAIAHHFFPSVPPPTSPAAEMTAMFNHTEPSQEKPNWLVPTDNPFQKFGYGGEQMGEYFIPGGAEEDAAKFLLPHANSLAELAGGIPKIGEYIKPVLGFGGRTVARALPTAMSTGGLNKLQGGDFWTGAGVGALGNLVAQPFSALAPSLAESSLGITKGDRAFGRGKGAIGPCHP